VQQEEGKEKAQDERTKGDEAASIHSLPIEINPEQDNSHTGHDQEGILIDKGHLFSYRLIDFIIVGCGYVEAYELHVQVYSNWFWTPRMMWILKVV
jgi:hypothetical protein